MSETFDDNEPVQFSRPPARRSRALLLTGAILLAGLIGFSIFASIWTERLWFASTGYRSVFSTLLGTRVQLFVGFGAFMALIVAANMMVAYRLRPVFRPASAEQVGLDRYREVVTPMRVRLVVGLALLFGLFAGSSASGQWRSYLLWANGVPFGKTDPYFDRDIGFYVFDLPWLHFLVDFVMAVLVVSLLATAVVHYLFGGIQLQNRHDRMSPAAAGQLSVLMGLLVLAKAADYWLGRYDLLNHTRSLFTGVSYTDDHAVLPAKNILAGIAVVCALLFFLNLWWRSWLLPSVGLVLLALSSILLGVAWPGIVQNFQVDPTEADKEAPYIQRNIDATRDAYSIGDVEEEAYSGTSALAPDELASAAINNPGIRLVDPQLAPTIFEQLQQVKGYYSAAPVLDVDRYDIEGQERDLVLGVRELDQNGLPENSKNWANLHTVYTHGYGLIAAYGNQRPADNLAQVTTDEPAWAETDIPPTGQLTDLAGPEGYEGRIYFGEQSPAYSIVGAKTDGAAGIELDLPGGEDGGGVETFTTYDGKAGVPIGGLLNKTMFAMKFGETNLILSERVHENSKILYDREPRRMVEKVAPWLTVDEDPFPAVINGRVVWFVDGYTVTDRYPLSQRESFETMTNDALAQDTAFQTLPTDEINYMRNAVKATVDAYDGTVTLYAWDEEDPMLQAWRSAFPGTVKDRADIPPEVLEHMRYPEDLFKVQRYQLASYHVTDAATFYGRGDQWEVPVDPQLTTTLQPPYRLSVQTPSGGEVPTFSLTSVYVPAKRANLAAFLSVDAAADQEGYGTLRVLRLSSASQIPGPGQIAGQFAANDTIQEELVKFTRTQSKAVYGNLLTLPVGGGLLYVQPLYAVRESGSGSYPVLKYVLVSLGNESGIGTTLEEAINDVLDIDPDAPPVVDPGIDPGPGPDPGGEPPTGTLSQQVRKLLAQADAQFAEADERLRAGDLAGYQEATKRAAQLVNDALALANKQADRSSN